MIVATLLLFSARGEAAAQSFSIDFSTSAPNQIIDAPAGVTISEVDVSSGSIAYNSFSTTFGGIPFVESGAGWMATTNPLQAKNFFFTITANPGFEFDLTDVSSLVRSTNAGPPDMALIIENDLIETIATPNEATPILSVSGTGLTDYTNRTEITIRVAGYDGGSRTSTGGGVARIGQVVGSVTVRSVSDDPLLAVSPTSITGLTYAEGAGPSSALSFSVGGSNLDPAAGSIEVNAEGTNFELSSDNDVFQSSVDLAYSGGDLSSVPVYIRLKAGLDEGAYENEEIAISGGSADPVILTASGTVGPGAPPPPSLTAFGVPYEENFSDFVSFETLPAGWSVSNENYAGNWGSGTAGGLRGNDNVLGFQHTGTTGVFTATLTLVNNTGGTIENLSVSYLGRVERATEGRAPEWTVFVDGVEAPGLSYSTEEGTDQTRSVTVSGLDIDDGAEVTIVWSSSGDVGTSGARRQIGISNVSVTAVDVSPLAAPLFDVPAGTYFEDQTVFVSNFGDYPGTVTVYYTTDGNDPDDSSAEYNNTAGILLEDGNGRITLKAIAIDDDRQSNITSAVYTFPVNVDDIQELRAQSTGSTIYRVANEATLTGKTEFRNTKFFQDDSGFGIQIDDPPTEGGIFGPGLISTEYNRGDNVASLVGTLSVFEEQLQMTPLLDPGAAVSSGNVVVPVIRTLDGLGFDDQARLVLIENVAFEDGDGSETFGGGGFQTSITDPSLPGFTGVYRNLFGESNITDSVIPDFPVNVTGVIQQRGDVMTIGARTLADFDPVEKTVVLTGAEGFRMLSSPIATDFSELLSPVWTQGIPNATDSDASADPNVWIWDIASGSGDAGNWEPVSDMENGIVPGTGFLAYIFEDDDGNTEGVAGGFPKRLTVNGAENFTGVTPPVNPNASGWTLLGNPFHSSVRFGALDRENLTNVIYVWDVNDEDGDVDGWDPGDNDPGAGSWKSWSVAAGAGDISGGVIAAFQGFFVQNTTAGGGEVSFPASAKTTGGEFLGKEVQPELVRLELSGQGMRNSAWFSFRDGGSLEVIEGDAHKLAPLSSNHALLAGVKGDTPLDISILPRPDSEFEFPVSVDATIPGTYTLTVTDMTLSNGQSLYILDRATNAGMALTKGMTYEFQLDRVAKLAVVNPFELLRSGPAKATAETEPRFVITGQKPVFTEMPGDVPKKLELSQNYPNPFNPSTVISYSVPEQAHVRLTVYDMLGREIAVLVNELKGPGSYDVTWDATDFSSGMYLYRIEAGTKSMTRRMTLVK